MDHVGPNQYNGAHALPSPVPDGQPKPPALDAIANATFADFSANRLVEMLNLKLLNSDAELSALRQTVATYEEELKEASLREEALRERLSKEMKGRREETARYKSELVTLQRSQKGKTQAIGKK